MKQKVYCVVKRLFEGGDREGKAWVCGVHLTMLEANLDARKEYDDMRRHNNALAEWSEIGGVRGFVHCIAYDCSISVKECEVEL